MGHPQGSLKGSHPHARVLLHLLRLLFRRTPPLPVPFGSLSFQFQSIKMAMSDFRRKKLLYVFSTFFDVDNSGGIDDKEFTAAAERLCRVHGDDQVDKDEWCNLFKNGCTEPWQQKYKDLIFDLHDTSGDGSVGEDEFVAVNAMGDVTAADCKQAFSKLTNGGSVDITRDVYTKLFNEYFASDDVNAAGNYIFGRSKF